MRQGRRRGAEGREKEEEQEDTSQNRYESTSIARNNYIYKSHDHMNRYSFSMPLSYSDRKWVASN